MAIIVELPRLSDTMEEGVIAKWHISEGDKVKRGQVIADIETDKATMEFESFDAGTVLKIVAPEGETLPLGAPIAVLGKPGEDVEQLLSGRKESGNGKAEDRAAAAPAPSAAPRPEPVPTPERRPEPVSERAPVRSIEAPRRDEGRVAASPLARRLARELGVSLEEVEGTGPHGRVVKADVEAAASRRLAAGVSARVVEERERPFLSRPDQPVKLSQMRKTIARRMSEAKREIPHFYLTIVVNMDNAVTLREQLKVALPDVKISFNDIILLAASRALTQHPEVNSYWDGTTIVRRGDVHLGVAVAVDDGLIVPVIRHADQKSLREIAIEARDLGTRGRDKKLSPDEMTGSTFTVSNLGMFGIDEFSAVINPGEGAILAVGAVQDEVVPRDGGVAVSKRLKATLACDHRVMDGAMGARFLATFRSMLEQPLALLA